MKEQRKRSSKIINIVSYALEMSVFVEMSVNGVTCVFVEVIVNGVTYVFI